MQGFYNKNLYFLWELLHFLQMKHYQNQFALFLYCKVWEIQILIYQYTKEVGKGGKPRRSNKNCKQVAANVTNLHKLAVQDSRHGTCKILATHIYLQQKLCISLEVRTADCTARKGKPYMKWPSNYYISSIGSSHRSLTGKWDFKLTFKNAN